MESMRQTVFPPRLETTDVGPIRRPAHAGTFYPAEPEALAALVDEQLAAAAGKAPRFAHGALAGLLVPHAGLVYSGPVAAVAWSVIGQEPPSTIVIAGTNHWAPTFRGVGVWSSGTWQTPLGDVAVDAGLARRIEALGPPFRSELEGHRPEHSIEVQLPFVLRVAPKARIVPLLVSPRTVADTIRAGEWLGRLLAGLRASGERVVLVASSDLAHYPDDALAREVDAEILEPILDLDAAEVARREEAIRSRGERGLVCGLCGLEPVLLTIAAVEEMGARAGQLLAEATSADVPIGDPERVVGYAAVAFVG
jgi:AmmeMemoRadiSam system protein B